MVFVYPNPPQGQECNHFNSYYINSDPMNNNNNSKLLGWSNGPGMEDPNKKVRKPYTIKKSRESWSEQEHDKFLEALQLFDRDWKKIEAFVGTKTVIQIRSHAQKYFLKVQKNGKSEHVPPPRPKRKAAHPYPQKAPKIVISQATAPLQPSATLVEPGTSMTHHDLVPAPINPTISSTQSSHWIYNVAPPVGMSHVPKEDLVSAGVAFTHNNYSSSSNESTPANAWTCNRANLQVQENHEKPTRVMPDFAQVYRFIGSVFDPNASDHLQRLKMMEPINVETAVMLMKNLSMNLASPEFDNHRKLLSTYNVEKDPRSSIQAV